MFIGSNTKRPSNFTRPVYWWTTDTQTRCTPLPLPINSLGNIHSHSKLTYYVWCIIRIMIYRYTPWQISWWIWSLFKLKLFLASIWVFSDCCLKPKIILAFPKEKKWNLLSIYTKKHNKILKTPQQYWVAWEIFISKCEDMSSLSKLSKGPFTTIEVAIQPIMDQALPYTTWRDIKRQLFGSINASTSINDHRNLFLANSILLLNLVRFKKQSPSWI